MLFIHIKHPPLTVSVLCVLGKMSGKQEPDQVPAEAIVQWAGRLWELVMCIEERSGETTPESAFYRILLHIILMQWLLEEEPNPGRLPSPTREP